MPVVRTSEKQMGENNRPDWSGVTSAGVFCVNFENGRFDNHFHDCNEYWLISKGKAKIISEGQESYVKPGDIVCTKAGDLHDFVEVYEDIEAFWFEDATAAGGRIGHLHHNDEAGQGHDVPGLPLPADFPQ